MYTKYFRNIEYTDVTKAIEEQFHNGCQIFLNQFYESDGFYLI